MYKRLLFALACIATPAFAYSQIDSTINTDQILDDLENAAEMDEELYISEELLEELTELQNGQKPNLNNLSYETAIRILHWNDYQYYQLQLYIENYGQLASIYEVSAIDGFTEEDMRRLLSKVQVLPVVGREPFFKNFFRKSSQSLLFRHSQILEQQAGYDTTRSNHYAGSPGHDCFRYSFSSQGKFFLKLSGEKDPGEQFFRGEQKYGFDFYSGSISIKDFGLVKAAVLGDYRLNFGQGLVMGSSLLSGKGSSPDGIRRFSTGIRAVAPTNEGDFLRGSAVTVGNHKISGSLFAGRQYGSLNNCFGADLSFQKARFRIGTRVIAYSVTDTSSSTLQKFKSCCTPTGFNASVDYQCIIKRQVLFGELAINQNGKIGVLQSVLLNLSPTFKTALVFRYYSNGYSSSLGRAFGSTSHNSGEFGIYTTSSWIVNRNCEVYFYTDYYHLTWLSYRTDAPVTGCDFGISTQYAITRYSKLSAKYTYRGKSQNTSDNPYYREIGETLRHKVRLQWSNEPYPFLKLKTEADWQLNRSVSSQTNKCGFLIYQDVAIEIPKCGLAVHTRLAYFDTDSYDERQYAYEDDVYYAFTVGSYYYKGIRGYLVLRYKYKWLSLWLRLSQTYYIDRQVISSGLTEIDKPHKSELKCQVMFSL